MKNPEVLLKDILRLKNDLEAQNMKLPPGLAGMYGEILAYKKLRQVFGGRGFTVTYFSGQKGADIQLIKGGKRINIEVKSSRLKEEAPGIVYGFAINIKGCRHHPRAIFSHPKRGKIKGDFCYFDYILAVAIPDNFEKARFYLFPRDLIQAREKSLRNKSKRFSSGSHRLIFVEKERVNNQELTKFDRYLSKNRKKFENAWNLIK